MFKDSYIANIRCGFTIVELLIAIVVVGILASISIVAYNGISERANIAQVQSDVKNGATVLEATIIRRAPYSGNCSDASVRTSSDNELNCHVSSTDFCIQVSKGTISYYATRSNAVPREGYCEGLAGVDGQPVQQPAGWVITAFAGLNPGYADGNGEGAQFRAPRGVAIAADGTVYVADKDNYRIRKITQTGVVTTLAGDGSMNTMYPTAVDVDNVGNVYVADGYSYGRVLKITPSGVVSTLAGSTASGYVDAQGASARFTPLKGIAVDASGNVYVSEGRDYSPSNTANRIRKITSTGSVTTLAGGAEQGYVDATGTAARFASPNGLDVDSAGNVYVADEYNNRIRRISPSGVVTTVAGGGAAGYEDGAAGTALFHSPSDVKLSGSTLYVSEYLNHRIRSITGNGGGVVTTIAGTGNDGSGSAPVTRTGPSLTVDILYPGSVAVDSDGAVYFTTSAHPYASYGEAQVRKITPQY